MINLKKHKDLSALPHHVGESKTEQPQPNAGEWRVLETNFEFETKKWRIWIDTGKKQFFIDGFESQQEAEATAKQIVEAVKFVGDTPQEIIAGFAECGGLPAIREQIIEDAKTHEIQIAALTKERDEAQMTLRVKSDTYLGNIANLKRLHAEQISQLSADVERLMELSTYPIEHRAHCETGLGPDRKCTCGLDQLKAALEKGREVIG